MNTFKNSIKRIKNFLKILKLCEYTFDIEAFSKDLSKVFEAF